MSDMAMDCETYKKNEVTGKIEPILDRSGKYFICGTIYGDEGKKTFTNRIQMRDYIIEKAKSLAKRNKKLHLYAHNMSYDFYNVFDMDDKGLNIMDKQIFLGSYNMDEIKEMTTEKFSKWGVWAKKNNIRYYVKECNGKVTITLKKEIIRFVDTGLIFRMKLEEIGKLIKIPKMEMPKEIGYKLTDGILNQITEYCLNDSKITYEAVKMIKKKISDNGIHIRNMNTINQIAIAYLINELKRLDINGDILQKDKKGKTTDIIIKSKYADDIHNAYRIGYLKVWKVGTQENCNAIDISSLYPYSASTMRMPNLRTERKIMKPLRIYEQKVLLNKIGLSRCMIKNTKDEYGMMLIRIPEKVYSIGVGKYGIGTWTNEELLKAIELGYEILDIEWSILYDEAKINIFKTLFENTFRLRKESGTDFDNNFYKDMMNRGIGKFGQRKNGYETITDSIELIDKYIKDGYNVLRGIPNSINMVYSRNVEIQKKRFYNPIIPCLINAHARIIMYEHYTKIHIKNLVYSDTDNIIWQGEHKETLKKFEIGDKMGQFKIEKDVETKEELLDKTYVGYGSKTKLIGNNISISGVVKSGITVKEFIEGRVKTIKAISMSKGASEDYGKFREEIHDLNSQVEKFLEGERRLAMETIYVDKDIENVKYFKKYIDKIGIDTEQQKAKDLNSLTNTNLSVC